VQNEVLPPAVAIVNPNRRDDISGLGHLAAVGLVFMTVVAVNRELRARGFWTDARPEPDLLSFLDDVALGTVADVADRVKLPGGARAVALQGLHRGVAGAAHTMPDRPLYVEVEERPHDVPVDGRTLNLAREYRPVALENLELRRDDGRLAAFVRRGPSSTRKKPLG